MEEIKRIVSEGSPQELRDFFAFGLEDSGGLDRVVFKFNLWIRKFFPQYFTSKDADFHKDIDLSNAKLYFGELASFINLAFRGAAKTARTKLFIAFAIANDKDHFRKYFKVLSEDRVNSRQIVTDIYNMLVDEDVAKVYPEVFAKTKLKHEEQMGSFTSPTFGVKVVSDTVIEDQRGALQGEARPDFIWFEDFENRKTLRSAVVTLKIWDNMEEARTSLAKGGSCLYTANYISEMGNVHKFVTKKTSNRKLLIVPIEDEEGEPTWARFSKKDIEQMRQDDEDFEGERMCRPSASKDIYFDRETLDSMAVLKPIRESAGFRMYKKFNPSHRYAGGHDIAGGVGLDSSTSVFIDFDTVPAQVVGTYADNEIKPEVFGHEVFRQADFFGGCLVAPENNYGAEALLVLKQLDANLFLAEEQDAKVKQKAASDYGWKTNSLTKSKMLAALSTAITDGLIALNDPDLIAEAKSYTRNDLIENVRDPRLTTRHFDLLMACAIAWQMKDYAKVVKNEEQEYDNAVDGYLNDIKSKNLNQKTYNPSYFDEKYFD